LAPFILKRTQKYKKYETKTNMDKNTPAFAAGNGRGEHAGMVAAAMGSDF
jgi:hypothetical protein